MTSVNGNGAAPRSHFLTLEFIGEVFLLAIVAALFVYMYLDSVEWDEGSLQWLPWRLDWSDGGWLLPRITILFGTPFWFWRAVSLFRAGASTTGGQIMDTGFLDTDDPATTIAWRWIRIFGTTAGLMIGVWVLGFHIAVPAYTMFYLIMFGKMKWYWTIVPAVFFELVIVGIYGYILLAEWGTPVARDWPIIGSIWDAVIDAWHNVYESYIE